MATLTIGIIGMVLVLTAYTLNQLGKLDDEHVVYDGMNFLGALLLMVYAFAIEGWPFFMLNAVWGAVAGHDLYKRYKPKVAAVKAEAKAKEPAEEKPKEEKSEEKPAEKPKEEKPEEKPAEEEAELTERSP